MLTYFILTALGCVVVLCIIFKVTGVSTIPQTVKDCLKAFGFVLLGALFLFLKYAIFG